MKNIYKLPLVISILMFTVSVEFIWISHIDEITRPMAIAGGTYTVICFMFLAFQIFTFARAHLSYDKKLEEVKYTVLQVEEETWRDYHENS